MALYRYSKYLQISQSEAFDGTHSPGVKAPHSGIYICLGCDWEVASNGGQPLPPQNHHQHTQAQGSIRWQLIVYAVHKD
jgi:hypothetical protein